jgi:hypothetical protein
MAIQFLNNLNINDNQLLNAKVQVASTAPTAAKGQIYLDSTTNVNTLKYHDGSQWVGLKQVNLNNSTFVSLADLSAPGSNIISLQASLNASGTPSATKYLRGDNSWADLPDPTITLTGDVTGVGAGSIVTTIANGAVEFLMIDPSVVITSSEGIPGNNNNTTLPTSAAVFNFVTGLGYVESVSAANSIFINTSISGTAADPIVTASLSATGTPDNTKYLRGDNTWSAISGIYSFNVSDGTTSSTVLNSETVTFSGTANEIEVAQSGRTVTIGLPNNVTIGGVLTVQGTGQSSFGGQVTIPTTPVASTDAASKAYVDASVAGGLVYQGGYDAATNTPNLDNPPTGTIKKGFAWTVTVDGVFFTEQVRVGDVLIAEIDTPTTLADWTTVQSNIDLATLTTVGIGNVNAGSGIGVAYSSGTATVTNNDKGSDQNIFKNIAVAGQSTVVADSNNDTVTLVAGNAIAITTNASTDEITIASTYTPPVTSYATTISNTGTITHGLNTLDVMVQLYDTVTNETVYADITRASVNTVTITFSATPTNPIRVLVQK